MLKGSEFQGRFYKICFGSVPIKVSQPPLLGGSNPAASIQKSRLIKTRVTSFSADLLMLKKLCEFPISVRLGILLFFFLPAAGNRNHNTGEVLNSGENGNYWSSTVNDINARNLNFNDGNVNVNNNNRAIGFSVRCVSALNANWFSIFG